jgi:CheY-like chemotaxis protein
MSQQENSDDNWLLEDDPADSGSTLQSYKRPWKILIVDDEPDVHSATSLAIRNIRYKERGLELISAYSAAQAEQMLQLHDHIALILLDVVMETDDAGLQLVQRIREVMQNNTTRIVLRTGQPGQAPEQEVILNYDINDYKTKTELTVQKLFTTVIASLRAYENLITIEKNRQGLAKILEGAADLYQMFSLKEFASGVLKQISAILDVGTDGILCVESTPDMTGRSWKFWLLPVPMKPCSKAAAWTTTRSWPRPSVRPCWKSAISISTPTMCCASRPRTAANLLSTSRRPGRWMMSSAICWKSSASAFHRPMTTSICTTSYATRRKPPWWHWPRWPNTATRIPGHTCSAYRN